MRVRQLSASLLTRRLPNGKRQLLRDLRVRVGLHVITVKRGFVTDFSSIPAFARPLVRFDRVDVAGVVHDWGYRHNGWDRAYWDRVWRLVAQHGPNGANAAQAWLCWAGLRVGGGAVWARYRRLGEEFGPAQAGTRK